MVDEQPMIAKELLRALSKRFSMLHHSSVDRSVLGPSVRYEDDHARALYLQGLAERLRRTDEVPLKAMHPVDDFGKDWKLKPGIAPRTFGHQNLPGVEPGAL